MYMMKPDNFYTDKERFEFIKSTIESLELLGEVPFWLAKDCMTAYRQLDSMIDRTTLPRRRWVGLTENEVIEWWDEKYTRALGCENFEDIYKAIEAKLKDKNT